MKRNPLGTRTGLEVGEIGLGGEHLERDRKSLDAVFGLASEAGIDYVDLVFSEPGYWDAIGPALRPHRARLKLAAHWISQDFDIETAQRCFDDVLSRLDNGYTEVAVVTMIDDERTWNGFGQESIARLQRYREQGRVGALAVSSHKAPFVLWAVQSGLLDAVMVGINMVEGEEPSMRALLQGCRELGVGVVAMKPFFGGNLLTVDGRPTGITPVQCLAYTLAQPVATVVPGVRNAAELQMVLHYLEASAAERDYDPVVAGLPRLLAGRCVYCNHCLPCPQGIDVAQTLMYSDWGAEGADERLRAWYAVMPAHASDCTGCGECMARCPYGVDVSVRMQRAVGIFGQ